MSWTPAPKMRLAGNRSRIVSVSLTPQPGGVGRPSAPARHPDRLIAVGARRIAVGSLSIGSANLEARRRPRRDRRYKPSVSGPAPVADDLRGATVNSPRPADPPSRSWLSMSGLRTAIEVFICRLFVGRKRTEVAAHRVTNSVAGLRPWGVIDHQASEEKMARIWQPATLLDKSAD